jgi:hypothetical protein
MQVQRRKMKNSRKEVAARKHHAEAFSHPTFHSVQSVAKSN